jgi:hypothetical protein
VEDLYRQGRHLRLAFVASLLSKVRRP